MINKILKRGEMNMEKAKEPENKLDQSLSEETLKDVSGGRDPFSRITYRSNV